MPPRQYPATQSAREETGSDVDCILDHPLYARLQSMADGEFLLPWSAELPALDSEAVDRLRDVGLIYTYRGGRLHIPLCYVAGMYVPGDHAGPGSTYPPPSVQAGASRTMYIERDRSTCHLCGQRVGPSWRFPTENPSLDHLIPRSKGGTDYPSNIRLSHASCNKGRRDRDVHEFREWLAIHQRRGDRYGWTA